MQTLVLEQIGSPASQLTVEEFLALSLPEGKAELVRGELRMTPPPGAPHGVAGSALIFALATHVNAHGLGMVLGDGFGYELVTLPRTVRVPDGSFIRAHRLPSEGVGPGLLEFAPDLAIEVLSPSETASEIAEKLADYALAGTEVVLIVDPVLRTVRIAPTNSATRDLHEGDALQLESVLPGFSMPVADIFAGIARLR